MMPGAVMVVVKIEGPEANTEKPRLCKTDEVGELCVSSGASGKEYWVRTEKRMHCGSKLSEIDALSSAKSV